ncbi:hypothetical protein DFH09DRAFT_1371380 [Mycena vulgaris]|nr:hypothetical protein DFH09DRAFT_1371380 [Mycena vulgaris]
MSDSTRARLGESPRSSNFISARPRSAQRLHRFQLPPPAVDGVRYSRVQRWRKIRLSDYPQSRPEARASKAAPRVDLAAPTPPCWALDFRASANLPPGLVFAHQLVPPALTRRPPRKCTRRPNPPRAQTQSCTPPTSHHSERTPRLPPPLQRRVRRPPASATVAAFGSARRQVPRGVTLCASRVKTSLAAPVVENASAAALHCGMDRSPRGVSSKVGREQRCSELASDARAETTAQRFARRARARAPDPVHLAGWGCAAQRSPSGSAPSSPPAPSISAWKSGHVNTPSIGIESDALAKLRALRLAQNKSAAAQNGFLVCPGAFFVLDAFKACGCGVEEASDL